MSAKIYEIAELNELTERGYDAEEHERILADFYLENNGFIHLRTTFEPRTPDGYKMIKLLKTTFLNAQSEEETKMWIGVESHIGIFPYEPDRQTF